MLGLSADFMHVHIKYVLVRLSSLDDGRLANFVPVPVGVDSAHCKAATDMLPFILFREESRLRYQLEDGRKSYF